MNLIGLEREVVSLDVANQTLNSDLKR